MERTIFETVGILGLDAILLATLALFALHAYDTWRPRRRGIDARPRSIDRIDVRLRDVAQRPHETTDEANEEPTRRAA